MSKAATRKRNAARSRLKNAPAKEQHESSWPKGLFVLAVALHLVMFGSLVWGYLDPIARMTDHEPQGADFFAIYHAGASILHGRSIYTWDPAFLEGVPYYAPYRYLPFFAASVGVAFNALPPWTGYWLWVALNELMLAANAWGTYRLARDRAWRWIAAALWFAFTPLYVEEHLGQWSFLMATLMFWMAALLLGGRHRLAGAYWAASLLVKSNSALLGPLLLVLREWKVLALAAALVVACNAPYFAVRPGDLRTFIDFNFGQFWGQQTINTLFVRWDDLSGIGLARQLWLSFRTGSADLPSSLQAVLVGVALTASLLGTFAPRAKDLPALFAMWSCVYFLAYFAWEPQYVMLLPAFALLVALRPQHRRLALFAFVLVALPTPYAIFQHAFGPTAEQLAGAPLRSPESYWPAWSRVLQHAAKPLPVALLWGSLVWSQLEGAYAARGDLRGRFPRWLGFAVRRELVGEPGFQLEEVHLEQVPAQPRTGD